MASFVRLPQRVLVAPEDAEALRRKWAEKSNQDFWTHVQQRRQLKARLILETETFVRPVDYDELPIG